MKDKTGRPKKPGKLYRFSLRYRPGLDPPELAQLLEEIITTQGEKRADILRTALLSGAKNARIIAAKVEDSFAGAGIDAMIDDF